MFLFLIGVFLGLGFGFVRCQQIIEREHRKFLNLKKTYLKILEKYQD